MKLLTFCKFWAIPIEIKFVCTQYGRYEETNIVEKIIKKQRYFDESIIRVVPKKN